MSTNVEDLRPEERRRYPRYECQYPIVIASERAGHHVYTDGECRMLSRGGFGATMSAELPPGHIVSVHFQAPRIYGTLRLEARVLYRHGPMHGFEFIAPDAEHRNAIAALFREAVGFPEAELEDI